MDANIVLQAVTVEPTTFLLWVAIAVFVLVIGSLASVGLWKLQDTFIGGAAWNDMVEGFDRVLAMQKHMVEQTYITQQEEKGLTRKH